MKQYLVLLTAVGAAITAGCGSFSRENTVTAAGNERSPLKSVNPEDATDESLIRFVMIQPDIFSKELQSNGTLSAQRKAIIGFKQEGTVERIRVREGDRVSQGEELASIKQEIYRRNLEQKELQLTKARLDFEDLLLRMGYSLQDTAKIDQEVLQMARIRSGLGQALYDLELAEEELANTEVTAPFSGVIADLQARPYNATSVSGGRLCTLIDDRLLMVEFPVLESELDFVRKSKRVTVSLFNDGQKSYPGTITAVNPRVDANGMVQVKASVKNTENTLLDGMNVRVTLSQSVPDQLMVPKEAVLDRQGRKVVFTYEDSLAKWNYVEIGMENSTHYTIVSGLEAGDKVIYEGNFNLAHDKPVEVKVAE